MPFRLSSLKTRTALANVLVIVVILVSNAVYLILNKRAELRKDIDDRAQIFALLTAKPLCEGYDLYYSSGFHKFREMVRHYLALEPAAERVLIINVSGDVVFDSAELAESGGQGAPARTRIEDGPRLEAVRKLELTRLPARGANGDEALEIIAPYVEDRGRHRLSVSYLMSYKSLRSSLTDLASAIAGLTLFSILLSILVAVALTSRITRPLEELTAGAQDIADGHFDRRLAIQSNDEIQILAEAFNNMAARLKENVEELEESNEKLAAVNQELKELDRMKSDLLANVSHELRTPLTAIKGYADYMLDRKLGPIAEKQEKGLIVIQRNLDRLAKSINALLDFSRMDVGRISLHLQPFNLSLLVEQIVMGLRSELERRRLTCLNDVEAALPPVIADREKLSQVLENLVINAIKFTPEGGRITVFASRSSASGRPGAEIRVSDTGIGIPRDQLNKIFNRFHQVDGSTTRRFGGVGLGLAIVKSILDAHGSTIMVDSEEGRGTQFRFVLPVLEKGAARVRDEGSAPAQEGTVLVVSPDGEMLRLARMHLEDDGLEALTALTVSSAAALAAQRRPDLIALLMPDSEGLAALASLRATEATAGLPTVVLPDRPGDGESRPFDLRALIAEARRHLGGRNRGGTERASL